LKDLPKDEVNFLDRGPELSRPARALSVWMLLRSAGADAIRLQIEEDLRLARLTAQLIEQDPRFEIVQEPVLSVVAFRMRARSGESEDERARRDVELMERSLASGKTMLSSTRLGGRSALRLVVQNHRTTEDDVRHTVRVLGELAE
jgi:aromatic-L-amino-acid decarboxylase